MKNNIDSYLKRLDPEMLAAYEEKHLEGKSLKKMNDEAKKIEENWKRNTQLKKLSLFAVFVSMAIATSLFSFPGGFKGFAIVMIVGPFPTIMYGMCFSLFGVVKDDKFYKQLESFKGAVEGLKCVGGNLSSESVRSVAVCLAGNILFGEKAFDACRMQENRDVYKILMQGNDLVESRKEFNDFCDCAKKFGLELSNSEIFAEARKRFKYLNSTK